MSAVDENTGQSNGRASLPGPEAPMDSPCPDQLRMARAQLLEAITVKFNNLFTTIVANCDMALIHLEQTHPAAGHLLSAKRAAYQASDANGRIVALVKECRESHK